MKLGAGLIAVAMAVLMPAASTATKPNAKHSKQARSKAVSSKTSRAKPGGVGKAGSARTTGGRGRGRGRGRTRKANAPSYQTHPDPERYRQIQQALADKGYYKGDINGQWGDDSTDALKRFQADQRLDSDGKINALTLRGLGLGPKHDGSTAPMSGAAGTAKTNAEPANAEPPPPVPTEAPAEPPE
jgi:hypothetical protein